jgi:hypothetical protein
VLKPTPIALVHINFIFCAGWMFALLAVLASSAAADDDFGNPTRQLLQRDTTATEAHTEQIEAVVAAAVATVRPAAQGIDQACVVQNCLQQGVACLGDKDCKAATEIIQACR